MSTYDKKSVKDLRKLASTRKIKGRSSMNKKSLIRALRSKSKKTTKKSIRKNRKSEYTKKKKTRFVVLYL
jgi:hypothetical protein